jgi:5-methylcytosine-specific restriction endonuclease McrA
VRLTYRSRIRGFRIIEDVDPEVVFARDHGVCYLCDLPVDRTYRAPTAATMDHVIPLSGGGVHSYANVRLAHRRCNLLKADKILDETGTKR